MTIDPRQIIRIADIPPIPHLLQKIMSLADDPKTTSQKLESLVVQEPALVTKILKNVNSALYSFPTKINSVRHSMIILGFATVKNIAAGLALMNAFENIPGIDKVYVLNIWRHGLKAAHYAKLLSYKYPNPTQDILYLGTLIQNVGYLVLKQYFSVKYDELLTGNIFPSPLDEEELLGTNHAIIGAALLEEWRFSAEIITLVLNHHDQPEKCENQKELAIVRLANTLALTDPNQDNWQTTGLNPEDLMMADIENDDLQSRMESFIKVPQMVETLIGE